MDNRLQRDYNVFVIFGTENKYVTIAKQYTSQLGVAIGT